MLVKHCPECREDYMPHVELCADCGGALVTRDEDAPLDDGSSTALPAGEYRLLVTSDRAAALDPLVARLARAHVPGKVEVGRRGASFELKVRDEDRAQALELLRDVLGDAAASEAAAERHFDAERGAYAQCPACETALPPGTRECPECGLLLGGDEEAPACEKCGAEFAPEAPRCGACGHAAE